jgi:branched-chain amino acid transport system substrate-binding protein
MLGSTWARQRSRRGRTVVAAVAVALLALVALAGCGGSSSGGDATGAGTSGTSGAATPAGSGKTIKVGIEADCKGAFGAFYQEAIGGVQAVFAQYGGKAKGSLPSDGMTGITIAGRPVQIVGYGCADATAAKGLAEARRLVEQDGAQILIGPLSGDEGVAVAEYAKSKPGVTFVNGLSGAQQTTLDVKAPNFFRFNPDGAQWNAGLGDYAYTKLGWRDATVIGDDYDFAYTSIAGFAAEFCSLGGNVTQRIWPPLGTADYSSYISQIPKSTDGLFVAIGGSGLVSFLKQYQQVNGALDSKKVMGNLFWPDPAFLKAIGTPLVGAVAANGIAADDTSSQTAAYVKQLGLYPDVQKFAPSVFVLGYWSAATALVQALQAVHGDLGANQSALQASLAKQVIDGPYGKISLDDNRQAIFDNWVVQVTPPAPGQSVPGVKTIERVPHVDQTFGGFFDSSTPPPSRSEPVCKKRTPPPWVGHEQTVDFGR